MRLLVLIPAIASCLQGAALNVVCTLEQPVAGPHEKVKATVVADVPDPASLQYRWTAQAGTPKEANGATLEWDPAGAAEGSYTLAATVTDADGTSGSCSLAVIIEGPQRGPASGDESERRLARALLVKDRPEEEGFGLYSYVLFAAPPADASDEKRYKKLIGAYLKISLQVKRLEKHKDASELNITYVPVSRELKVPDVDSILRNYNYDRAQKLLYSFAGTQIHGIFLASSLHPPKPPARLKDKHTFIVQNLSLAPDSVIDFWMDHFLWQTAQPRFWEQDALRTVTLRMRTVIAVAAVGLPEVVKALPAWINFGGEK